MWMPVKQLFLFVCAIVAPKLLLGNEGLLFKNQSKIIVAKEKRL
jgi:hypothetical protein